MIVRLYTADAEMRPDDELVDDVGWRLLARAEPLRGQSAGGLGDAGCVGFRRSPALARFD
jgi:hypothetical protein